MLTSADMVVMSRIMNKQEWQTIRPMIRAYVKEAVGRANDLARATHSTKSQVSLWLNGHHAPNASKVSAIKRWFASGQK